MTWIDFSQSSLYSSALCSFLNVFLWNVVARLEYKTHFLTKLAGGKYRGCYFLALCIFLAGLYRSHLFSEAVENQPKVPFLNHSFFQLLAIIIGTGASVLVFATYYQLGITGTYLGDYFGILMDEKVEGFPFNIMANPMYNGSALTFVALSIWHQSPAGFLLSLWIFMIYRVAILFEEPFTGYIYAQRDKEKAKSKKQ
eukprot:TRINITY_DN3705_c0_g1_i1.p1 TRINITY_DN3705_c0_g1~~TRINITY_DN3705_c0_g1_i1.p1  ORF type:complete len:198 (-),score=47.51 TRINITY_DN3705_c0_g1_i1:41-634(-)